MDSAAALTAVVLCVVRKVCDGPVCSFSIRALPVGFQSAFDLINDGDWTVVLVLLGNRERGKPARTRAPACKRKLYAAAIGGETNEGGDRDALGAGYGKVELVGQGLALERRVEFGKRLLGVVVKLLLNLVLRDLVAETGPQGHDLKAGAQEQSLASILKHSASFLPK